MEEIEVSAFLLVCISHQELNKEKAKINEKYHRLYKNNIRPWKIDSQNFVLNNLWRIKPAQEDEKGYETEAISEIAEGLEYLFNHYFHVEPPAHPKTEKPKENESEIDTEERLEKDRLHEVHWKKAVAATKQYNKKIADEEFDRRTWKVGLTRKTYDVWDNKGVFRFLWIEKERRFANVRWSN